MTMKKKAHSSRSRAGKKPSKKKTTSRKKPNSSVLQIGKLPAPLLEKCLSDAVLHDPWVLQGPKPGADAAIVQSTEDLLVVSSDPITFVSAASGLHLLSININDIVTTGGYPRWLNLTYLLPPGTTEEELKELFSSLGEACKQFEVSLIGGHTEVTDAVTRPVAVGTLIGILKKDRRVDPSRCQAGDFVILVGSISVEGTAILAKEKKKDVAKALGKEFQAQAENLMNEPGICIKDAALLASAKYLVNAMHDPTEGGIATALRELSAFCNLGIQIEKNQIPILPETLAISQHFDINPYGLLASGSLLLVLDPDEAERFQESLNQNLNLPAKIIGQLTDDKTCLWREDGEDWTPIPEFTRDELSQVL